MATRIILVDDHRIILESLEMVFDLIDGIEVVATTNDSREVMGLLESHSIDVLVTDLSMPYLDGIGLSRQVKKAHPNLKILMLTVSDEPDQIHSAYKSGISGYVLKKAGKDELERAIKIVVAGELYFGPEAMQSILAGGHHESNADLLDKLTKREIEIIRLMVQENSSAEIAAQLVISLGTVETHRHNIFKKLEVKNVVGVVKFALKHSLISP